MRAVVRLVISALVSAVLVATVISPVAAAEIEPATIDVPPLVSEPLESAETTFPEGDFTDVALPVVPVVGKEIGRPRPGPADLEPSDLATLGILEQEVVARDEFTTTFENPEGGLVDRVSSVPINAENDEHEWSPRSR